MSMFSVHNFNQIKPINLFVTYKTIWKLLYMSHLFLLQIYLPKMVQFASGNTIEVDNLSQNI